jgi:hypothetical protein
MNHPEICNKFGMFQHTVNTFFETHRHIGHIVFYKQFIINNLCDLCAYVFQKKSVNYFYVFMKHPQICYKFRDDSCFSDYFSAATHHLLIISAVLNKPAVRCFKALP